MSEPTGGTPPPEPGTPPPPQPAATPPPQPAATPPQQPSSWQGTSPMSGAAVEPGPAPGVAYADLTTRIIAFIIDAILLSILFAFVFFALGAIFLTTLLNGNVFVVLVVGVVLAIAEMVVSALYFIWGWTNPTMRASLGQRVMGLNTVNAADGATLTRDQAARRWAFLYGFVAAASALQITLSGSSMGALASLLGLVAFGYTIYLLWTTSQSPKRQGFHDVQAATVVVKMSK